MCTVFRSVRLSPRTVRFKILFLLLYYFVVKAKLFRLHRIQKLTSSRSFSWFFFFFATLVTRLIVRTLLDASKRSTPLYVSSTHLYSVECDFRVKKRVGIYIFSVRVKCNFVMALI